MGNNMFDPDRMLPDSEDIEDAYRAALIRGEREEAEMYLKIARLEGVPEETIRRIQDEAAESIPLYELCKALDEGKRLRELGIKPSDSLPEFGFWSNLGDFLSGLPLIGWIFDRYIFPV